MILPQDVVVTKKEKDTESREGQQTIIKGKEGKEERRLHSKKGSDSSTKESPNPKL